MGPKNAYFYSKYKAIGLLFSQKIMGPKNAYFYPKSKAIALPFLLKNYRVKKSKALGLPCCQKIMWQKVPDFTEKVRL